MATKFLKVGLVVDGVPYSIEKSSDMKTYIELWRGGECIRQFKTADIRSNATTAFEVAGEIFHCMYSYSGCAGDLYEFTNIVNMLLP